MLATGSVASREYLKDSLQIRAAVEMRLGEILRESSTIGRKPKVLLLGRYQKDNIYLPNCSDSIELDFITIHSSKGLEADHIILPRMTSETLGFPSQIADDPVLLLAMPGGDAFENAEERRLFYVALTRARATVTLITIAHKETSSKSPVSSNRTSTCPRKASPVEHCLSSPLTPARYPKIRDCMREPKLRLLPPPKKR